MNVALSRALLDGGTAAARARRAAIQTDISGGRVVDWPGLSATKRAAIEAARARPPPFASLRNLAPEDEAILATEELPGDLRAPQPRLPTGKRRRERKRKRLPRGDKGGDTAQAGAADAPPGPIRIAQLFADGVYESKVQAWFRAADAAVTALRRRARGEGVEVPRVPTVVVEQEEMAPWAKGIVWDCGDPKNCESVRRSTRHTCFGGTRQIDREALRAAAEDMDWPDRDIVEQVGEGGVEARADCELITSVLAFHHPGLVDQAAAAAAAVEADRREGWVAEPVRHLPFVPCRLQPRDVIMQARQRVVAWGGDAPVQVEHYEKPQVTTNASFGGVDAVNTAVPVAEQVVRLPRAQKLGRAMSIIDTCRRGARAGERPPRAVAWVADAESAYRFCPVQRADLWLQCFVWWDDQGRAAVRAVVVDERMGIGAAYAPNRFERISTLVAAWVQRKQAQFDEQQPPTSRAVRAWAERRRRVQRLGGLRAGAEQVAPRYVQVYIDDFTGVALDDLVTPPARVRNIVIQPVHTEAGGSIPAPPGSRAHVHAQLAVLGLKELGLHAAPTKVVVGDPVVALGLSLGVHEGRLRCPEGKRELMRAAIAEHRDEALQGARVHWRRARTLVGRLANIAQVLPELRRVLRGGYAVAQPPGGGARHAAQDWRHLRKGGRAESDWL
eukprot:2115889-Pleurochrysis_carterae.AAC.2